MAVDVEYIGNIAPEIKKKETPERILFMLGIAVSQINISAFGSQSDLATALLACHLMTVFNRKGNAQTQMSKVGDVQRQYAVPKTANDAKNYLCTSSYGMELWRLMKTRVTTPYIVGDDGNNNPSGGGAGDFGFPPP